MVQNANIKSTGLVKDIGRPSKFTPERRAEIIDAIGRRVPYAIAAEANGICETTLFDWLRTAKVHQEEGIESDFTEFRQAIKRVEMTRIYEHMNMIAAKPDRWQADAWLLERRWPKHFSSNVLLAELNQRLNQIENDNSKVHTAQIETTVE